MVIALRSASSDLNNSYSKQPSIAQVAALCYRDGADGLEILLITSSNGRWILPKGWPMDDRSDAQAAQQEAWEEAGVKDGALQKTPLGSYVNTKAFENGATALCDTAVYPIEVSKLFTDFPEANMRDRKWVRFEDAPDAVDDPDLAVFLQGLRPVV